MAKRYQSRNSAYTLHFSSVLNSQGTVRFIDHSRDKDIHIGFSVDDGDLGYRVQQDFPPIIADLIDLAVAIHASDRLAFQNLHQEQSHISIVLPVRHPELLSAQLFQEKLEKLLEWTTGSRWIFDFQKRSDLERPVIGQSSLPLGPKDCEVSLWSGGLDAFAGVYTRLKEYSEKSFVLFGTGSNDNVYALQEKTAKQIQLIFPNRSHLYRLPIRFNQSNSHTKNKVTRARGVVFTLLGSAVSTLMGQRKLYVYENGIGAINLPYRASAVGLDHSRSVHPLTLLMVSEVVSELLGENFQIRNPFLFSTKADMCQILAEDKRADLASLTKSCDRPHRQQPDQCGYCSSCLLRRQALAASKIEDKTSYVIFAGNYPATDPSVYLRHMSVQVDDLRCLLGSDYLSGKL
jgi:hypothetical protein